MKQRLKNIIEQMCSIIHISKETIKKKGSTCGNFLQNSIHLHHKHTSGPRTEASQIHKPVSIENINIYHKKGFFRFFTQKKLAYRNKKMFVENLVHK